MFQKVGNSMASEKDTQDVRQRPDEKVEAPANKRLRGSNVKLSARGKKHRKGRKSSRRS